MKPIPQNRQRQFAHYLNDDEEMLFFTTVSSQYLLHKFFIYFLSVSLFTLPGGYLVSYLFGFDLNLSILSGLIVALLYACQRYYFTKEGIQYILTTKRLIVQIGFFKVTLFSANYNKITHIEVDQGLMDRMFYKHGRILVMTAGFDKKPITLNYIGNPIEFKNSMEQLISQERQKYGHTSI